MPELNDRMVRKIQDLGRAEHRDRLAMVTALLLVASDGPNKKGLKRMQKILRKSKEVTDQVEKGLMEQVHEDVNEILERACDDAEALVALEAIDRAL